MVGHGRGTRGAVVGDGRGTVLVTGAGGGIGSAVCRRLAADGWRVVVTTHPSEQGSELAHAGVARILPADLLDARDRQPCWRH